MAQEHSSVIHPPVIPSVKDPAVRPAAVRIGAWLLLAVFTAAACSALAAVLHSVHPWRFIVSCAVMFICMLILTRLSYGRRFLIVALSAAVLIRILYIVYYPASDDVNRYVWEGRIQLYGFNPFTTAPDAPETEHLRDNLWHGINHPHITTIYWPFAQLLFKGVAAVSPTVTGFKILMTLFDLLTLLMLGLLLRRRSFPYRYLLLYALNPLVLVMTSGQGHMEALVVMPVVATIYLAETGRYRMAAAVFSCAVLTKLNVILLLPLLIRSTGWKKALWFLVPLPMLLLYGAHPSVFFATPLLFARDFAFNGMFQVVLSRYLGVDSATTLHLLTILLAGGGAVVFFCTPSLLRAGALAIGLLLLCMPTVHPWYVLMMTPFCVFFRQGSWLTLHLTSLFMLFYFDPAVTAPLFHNRPVLFALEYLPFCIVGIVELLTGRKRWPVRYAGPRHVSVVIPAFNESGTIHRCIASVREQGLPVEIIVVDGGSTDDTRARVGAIPDVRLLRAPPGRGVQIAEGVRQSSGDTVVVLHADARLAPGALREMVAMLKRTPDAAGGAMHGRYATPAVRMRLTELLNMIRARFFGISFGDQAQFFRRDALTGGFPEYKLMEDVELSLRLKEQGTMLYCRRGVICSSRRWKRSRYFSNFLTVIYLTAVFLVMRSFGGIRNRAEWFYNSYYRKKK